MYRQECRQWDRQAEKLTLRVTDIQRNKQTDGQTEELADRRKLQMGKRTDTPRRMGIPMDG